mgnify:CR=1 FL=1
MFGGIIVTILWVSFKVFGTTVIPPTELVVDGIVFEFAVVWVGEIEIVAVAVTCEVADGDDATEVINVAGNTLQVKGPEKIDFPLTTEAVVVETGIVNIVVDPDVFALRCWSLVGSLRAAIGTAMTELPSGAGTNAICKW